MEDWCWIIELALLGIVLYIAMLYRYDVQVREQNCAIHNEQIRAAQSSDSHYQQVMERNERVLERDEQLQDRWERVLARLESLADRLERS